MTTWHEVYQRYGLHDETPEEQQFWQRLCHPPALPRPAPPPEHRLRFIMSMIAYHSGALEGDAWNRWELHTDALYNAFCTGQEHKDVNMYHFLTWHRAILPHGGTLRTLNPVSVGMGESFRPEPVSTLGATVNQFVRLYPGMLWFAAGLKPGLRYLTLAEVHFNQWRMHPFADGNKRHARLMTIYGCGWLGLPPVDITLAEKGRYLDALAAADLPALARLFRDCAVSSFFEVSQA